MMKKGNAMYIDMDTHITLPDSWQALMRTAMETALQSIPCALGSLEVSVLVVDNAEIAQINRQMRGIDLPTDVLSFPMLDYEVPWTGDITPVTWEDVNPETGHVFLGDIVVSLPKALAQAEEFGHSTERELAFLCVHGVLHLLGYDHEELMDAAAMEMRQEEIMRTLGLERK